MRDHIVDCQPIAPWSVALSDCWCMPDTVTLNTFTWEIEAILLRLRQRRGKTSQFLTRGQRRNIVSIKVTLQLGLFSSSGRHHHHLHPHHVLIDGRYRNYNLQSFTASKEEITEEIMPAEAVPKSWGNCKHLTQLSYLGRCSTGFFACGSGSPRL